MELTRSSSGTLLLPVKFCLLIVLMHRKSISKVDWRPPLLLLDYRRWSFTAVKKRLWRLRRIRATQLSRRRCHRRSHIIWQIGRPQELLLAFEIALDTVYHRITVIWLNCRLGPLRRSLRPPVSRARVRIEADQAPNRARVMLMSFEALTARHDDSGGHGVHVLGGALGLWGGLRLVPRRQNGLGHSGHGDASGPVVDKLRKRTGLTVYVIRGCRWASTGRKVASTSRTQSGRNCAERFSSWSLVGFRVLSNVGKVLQRTKNWLIKASGQFFVQTWNLPFEVCHLA